MAENKLADMSTEFAVKILNLTEGIKGHYSLSNQLDRSGTSIGANIRDANYGLFLYDNPIWICFAVVSQQRGYVI